MFQNGFYVSIRQTDKREVSDAVHELPPDNGPFEEYRVADYPGCPKEWSKDGLFIPVNEGQPLWFDFRGNIESACLASVQRINPATGEKANIEGGLSKNPLQNYLKLPDQLWLDGYSKEGKVYQFVVVTEGKGEAVNEVLLPKNMQDSHAMGFAFFLPKPRSQYRHNYSDPSNPIINGSCRSSSSARAYKGMTRTVTTPEFSLPNNANDLIIGDHGDNQRFTQNRVADHYNCSNMDAIMGTTNGGGAMCDASDISNISYDDRAADMCVTKGKGPGVVDIGTIDIDTSHLDQASMGAGGRIGQDIVYDNNTVEYYQDKPSAILTIYLALPEMFKTITKSGKRQNKSRKDKYTQSAHIGGVAIPLVS